MKILAIEHETPGVEPGSFAPHLAEEARAVWDLYQSGILREPYFRADSDCAVLVLECENLAEAESILGKLPLVQAGLIHFQCIPLRAYPGFSRLFA